MSTWATLFFMNLIGHVHKVNALCWNLDGWKLASGQLSFALCYQFWTVGLIIWVSQITGMDWTGISNLFFLFCTMVCNCCKIASGHVHIWSISVLGHITSVKQGTYVHAGKSSWWPHCYCGRNHVLLMQAISYIRGVPQRLYYYSKMDLTQTWWAWRR